MTFVLEWGSKVASTPDFSFFFQKDIWRFWPVLNLVVLFFFSFEFPCYGRILLFNDTVCLCSISLFVYENCSLKQSYNSHLYSFLHLFSFKTPKFSANHIIICFLDWLCKYIYNGRFKWEKVYNPYSSSF